jgi:hypothetical protein
MQRRKTEANTGGDTGPRRGSRAGQIAFACALLLIGLFSVYYPTLLSGFRQLQQNLGDPRLVNYVLEHGFRWVSRGPLHESLWAPPFYHPAPNVGALHDTLLGLGPLYWPLRWLGLPPDTAYQVFMLVVSVLNYAAAFAFMRLGLKVSTTAAAGGAFLFAFANPRTGRVLHQQLVAGYLPVLAVLCLVFLFRADSVTARRRWAAAVFVCWVAQMWSGFYWAWYLVFALCIAAVWSLARPGPRRAVAGALRDTWAVVFLSAAAALALTVPMVLQHLAAAAEVGFHDFEADVLPRTARLASWLYMGTPNLSYGLLQEGALFQSIPIPVEQQLGVGLITLLAVIWGLWTHRERRLVVVFVQVALTLALLSTVLPGGFTLWRWVYDLVPGAGAIRAPARSGVFILLPLAVGFALALARLEGRGRHLLAAGLLALCVIEQVRYQPSFDKLTSRAEVASIRNAVPPDCAVFYAVNRVAEDTDVAFNPWKYHLDAMWAQLDVGIPAVNGYSGFQPAGWRPLYPNVVRTVEERDQLESVLSEWLGEEMGGACMVEVTLP